MFLHIVDVKHIEKYRIALAFSDGRKGIADLENALSRKHLWATQGNRLFRKDRRRPGTESDGPAQMTRSLAFQNFSTSTPSATNPSCGQIEAWGYKAKPFA